MKVKEIAAFAEIISSVAIVLTLIYLAVQTQQMAEQTEQTNSILLSSSRLALLESDLSILNGTILTPEVFVNSYSLEELTPLEEAQVNAYFYSLNRVREFAFNQYQLGLIDQGTWDSYSSTLIDMLNNSRKALALWKERTAVVGDLTPEFVEEINRRLDSDSN